MRILLIIPLLMSLGSAVGVAAEPSIDDAQQLIGERRYAEALTVLQAIDTPDGADEVAYLIDAEIGRCYFHLGDYPKAHERFAAAMRRHPDRVEVALYLEATAYLLGKKELALRIFEQVLASGASDLYLAVTLPGERRFLAEAAVWKVLDDKAIPIEVDIDAGTALGVVLGSDRRQVLTVLGTDAAHRDAPAISAQAGPLATWAFSFDDDGLLDQFAFFPENLLRYTPYRLALTCGLDWNATPAGAINVLGVPSESGRPENGGLELTWHFENRTLQLEFGAADQPTHPGLSDAAAALKKVHLKLRP